MRYGLSLLGLTLVVLASGCDRKPSDDGTTSVEQEPRVEPDTTSSDTSAETPDTADVDESNQDISNDDGATADADEDVATSAGELPAFELWGRTLRFDCDGAGCEQHVAADPDGNVILAGTFDRIVGVDRPDRDKGAGRDIYMAKFDIDGRRLWSNRYGGKGDQEVTGLDVGEDGSIVVCGDFNRTLDFGGEVLESRGMDDLYVATFDADGNQLWRKRFGKTFGGGSGDYQDDHAEDVAVDAEGNILLTGWYLGSRVDFGGGALTPTGRGLAEAFAASFTARGEHRWSHNVGDTSASPSYLPRSEMIVPSTDGGFVIAGFFAGNLDLGGRTLTSSKLQAEERAGRFAQNVFVASFDQEGSHVWSRRLGNEVVDLESLDVHPGGDTMLMVSDAGATGRVSLGADEPLGTRGADLYLIRFDEGGDIRWTRVVESTAKGVARHPIHGNAALVRSGGVHLAGHFKKSLTFGGKTLKSEGKKDLFTAMLTADGDVVSVRRFGDADDQSFADLTLDSRERPIVIGRLSGELQIGAQTIRAIDTKRPFLARWMRPAF